MEINQNAHAHVPSIYAMTQFRSGAARVCSIRMHSCFIAIILTALSRLTMGYRHHLSIEDHDRVSDEVRIRPRRQSAKTTDRTASSLLRQCDTYVAPYQVAGGVASTTARDWLDSKWPKISCKAPFAGVKSIPRKRGRNWN